MFLRVVYFICLNMIGVYCFMYNVMGVWDMDDIFVKIEKLFLYLNRVLIRCVINGYIFKEKSRKIRF